MCINRMESISDEGMVLFLFVLQQGLKEALGAVVGARA